MKNLGLVSLSEMSTNTHAGEIIATLTAVIVRTLVADEPKQGAVDLDFLPDQRVHTIPYQGEKL